MAKHYKPKTVKLEEETELKLKNHCNMLGTEVSTFIRESILEKMNGNHVSNVAGKNKIAYNPKKDCFEWKIELDSGEEKAILENVPLEFLDDLRNQINLKIHEREQILKKKTKKSVAVPRRLVR